MSETNGHTPPQPKRKYASAPWTEARKAKIGALLKARNADPAFQAKRKAAYQLALASGQMKKRGNGTKSSLVQAHPQASPMSQPAPAESPATPAIFTVMPGGIGSDGANLAPTEGPALDVTIPPFTPEPRASAPDAEAPAAETSAPATNGRHNIHWKPSEIEIVADEVARLIRKAGWRHAPEAGDRVGRNLLGDMLAAGQTLLPRERRRAKITPWHMKAAFWADVEHSLASKRYLKGAPDPDAAKIAPVTTPAAAVAPVVAAPPVVDTTLASASTGALLTAALSRLLETVGAAEAIARDFAALKTGQQKFHEQIMSRLADMENKAAAPIVERVRLPKVAILGCQLYEFHQIRKGAEEAGLHLDLRHYDQEAKPTPINAEWALSLRFVNHPQLHQIAAAGIPAARSRTILQGGVTKAVAQLLEWFPVSA